MPDSSFNNVTRRLHRQTIATFGSLVLAVLLAGMLALGGQHTVEQIRAKLTTEFNQRVEYLLEQEHFLQQLHAQNTQQQGLPEQLAADVRQPFDFLPGTPGAAISPAYAAVGTYLSRQYSAFWAFSSFPAAPLLVVNADDGSAVLVPGRSAGRDSGAWLQQATAIAQREGLLLPAAVVGSAAGAPAVTAVRWLAVPGEPGNMLAVAHAGFRRGRVSAITSDASKAFMAMMFSDAQLFPAAAESSAAQPRFWLRHAEQGLLLGQGPPPDFKEDGLRLHWQGLGLRVQDRSGEWIGYYQIGYGSLFADNLWILAVALALFVLAVLGGIGYVRWYRLQVIEPARQAQEQVIESEAFNRTLIETTPVALCLVTREGGRVVFATDLARQWLQLVNSQPLTGLSVDVGAWARMLQAGSAGVIEKIELANGRSLHMTYAPTRYHGQDVVLCAFTDITIHAEEQRALARARTAADEANAAKSTFLATMSHEIRTPLYGLLGTLELLALTELNGRQSQHVNRLQDASQQLLQQISDILDISKIEAGQMQVESKPFNPRELVEQCTATYAAMARQKGLLLFCTIDHRVPEAVIGDPLRVRQVVSNLISNAVKFTPSGHIIVRLTVERGQNGTSTLQWQVADSGIGVPADKLDQLFTPFNALNQSQNTIRGTGLGLSICQRLAGLMGGALAVVSEAGLGSSFSLTLTLADAVSEVEQEALPQLSGLKLLLRSPHPALSAHLRDWLVGWGAEVELLSNGDALPMGDARLLLDVQMAATASSWNGPHLRVAPPDDQTRSDMDGDSVNSIGLALQRWLQQLPAVAQRAKRVGPPRIALDVLVAEDNPINQATLYDQLLALGCKVTVAGDGEQALAQWKAHAYDVVLTDINMPRMNGYELTRALRGQGARCAIIGVTANAMRDEEQRCLDSGMDAWLVKPVDLQHLHRLLQQWQPHPQPVLVESSAVTVEEDLPQLLVPEKYREVFRTTMRVDIDSCRDAIAAADSVLVMQKLHRMRGALVTVGGMLMAGTLEDVEQRLASEAWGPGLSEDLFALCQALDKLVAST